MDPMNIILVGNISVDGGPPRPCQISALALPVPPGVGDPPHIWGPTDPRPTPPIVLPIPNPPHEPPLVIWGPNDPRPTPPITWPGYPAWPPTGTSPMPPTDKWYWKYCPDIGWVLVPPGGGGKPQPTP